MVGDTVGANLYDPVIMGELRRWKGRDARRGKVRSAGHDLADQPSEYLAADNTDLKSGFKIRVICGLN